jgi:hypothetical protein
MTNTSSKTGTAGKSSAGTRAQRVVPPSAEPPSHEQAAKLPVRDVTAEYLGKGIIITGLDKPPGDRELNHCDE